MTSIIINRNEVTRDVGEVIYQLRHDTTRSMKRHILILHGPRGIGRTRILRYLEEYYTHPQSHCIPLRNVENNLESGVTLCGKEPHIAIPCFFLDFIKWKYWPNRRLDHQMALANIMREIASEFRKYGPDELQTHAGEFVDNADLAVTARYLEEDIPQLDRIYGLVDQFETMVDEYIRFFKAVMVLIDNYDDADLEFLRYFEANLLDRMRAKTGFVVVICAIKRRKWQGPVSQYTHHCPLTVFPLRYTDQQIRHIDSSGVATAVEIQKLTGGHPVANGDIVRQFNEERHNYRSWHQWIEEKRKRILSGFKKTLVEKNILAIDMLPDEFRDDVRDAFWKLSTVRVFDRDLLINVIKSEFKPREIVYDNNPRYDLLIQHMQSQGILFFDGERKLYSIEAGVRRMLSEYYRYSFRNDYSDMLTDVVIRKYDDWLLGSDFTIREKHWLAVEKLYLHSCIIINNDRAQNKSQVSSKLVEPSLKVMRPSFPISREEMVFVLQQEKSDHISHFAEIADLDILITHFSGDDE